VCLFHSAIRYWKPEQIALQIEEFGTSCFYFSCPTGSRERAKQILSANFVADVLISAKRQIITPQSRPLWYRRYFMLYTDTSHASLKLQKNSLFCFNFSECRHAPQISVSAALQRTLKKFGKFRGEAL